LPHLRAGTNPHILRLSPPISLELRWLAPHTAYTIAKYGMTLCALGLAAELLPDRIASNALWPRTLVATAAVRNLLGGEAAISRARNPAIYADAAHLVLRSDSETMTGKALLCEDMLLGAGITDLPLTGTGMTRN
jgi:citronellol/citronellal dehydrogenase